MATTTPNLGLTLPGLDDQADIAVLNQDYTLIDTAVGTINDSIAAVHQISDISSKLENAIGVYIKIGKTIIVTARFRIASAITAGDTLFTLPVPYDGLQAVLPTADANTGVSDGTVLYIRSSGECRLFNGAAAGKYYNVSGSYIAGE